jgi:hypothetical protein
MSGIARWSARLLTLSVAVGGLALAVWSVQRDAAPPEPRWVESPQSTPGTRTTRKAKSKYGIFGPDSKADPHMARTAAKAAYEAMVQDGGAAQAEQPPEEPAPASGILRLQGLDNNLNYLPGSKSGFGGLGTRGTGHMDRSDGGRPLRPSGPR